MRWGEGSSFDVPACAVVCARRDTWVLLVSIGASACADGAPGEHTQGYQLAESRAPSLGCFEAVSSPGECRRDADCDEGEHCVLDDAFELVDRAPVPLICGAARGTGLARERCSEGDQCESGLCALAGVCLEPCRDAADCAPGQYCRPIEVHAGEDALAPVMACARPLALPADVQITVSPEPQRLHVGLNALRVPSAADPAIVYVQGECGRSLELLTLRSNDPKRELYDKAGLRAGKRAENPVLHDGSALATLIFPNNPALTAGGSGLTLGVFVTAEEHAEVVVASRAARGRMLDLNLFYVGGGESASPGGMRPGDANVARMVRRLDQRLRAIGLSLGEIREHEVVGALREELAVLEVSRRMVGEREVEGRPQRLDELFRLSAGEDAPGINVFLVRDMGSYLGISGGIPGVLGVHGTARSGVALAVDLMGTLDGADLVLMHEIAHYMGLFHTTESSGLVLDPLSDTAECASAQDEDENEELSAWECEQHGADNLMFWSGAGELLTEQQIQVLTSSVVLR